MNDQKSTTPKIRITDIRCPGCGAPAHYNILRQSYLCGYCGGQVGIQEACREKEGFRRMQAEKLSGDVRKFRLVKTTCTGCGATVVFDESEALSNCAFCGRSLVRTEYLNTRGLPESIIPFAITGDEAKERLRAWCGANPARAEARHLKPLVDELKGFYLPYELVRGPVHMKVARMDGGSSFSCEGFINDEFVNRSGQLDNLLLDGMEPFGIDSLTEFDFSYVAGQRVKISDISDQELKQRADAEAAAAYTPSVRKTMESKAVYVDADVREAVRLPVLLPVYYLSKGELMAAVNGQTGKVSVRAEKESHYYFLPWWLKAILASLIFCLVLLGAFRLFGMPLQQGLFFTGLVGIIFLIVNLCLYSDTTKNNFSVESGREIFTSGDRTFHRERGGLVRDEKLLARKVQPPVFFQKLDGEYRPVILKFTTPGRIVRMAVLCVVALFLPVIVALFLNGFDFRALNLGGSAAWFCLMVPVVPIYLLKFGIVELYERPLIYTLSENGRKKRLRRLPKLRITGDTVLTVLKVLFVPPVSLAVWFGIISFFVMCCLTAGFE